MIYKVKYPGGYIDYFHNYNEAYIDCYDRDIKGDIYCVEREENDIVLVEDEIYYHLICKLNTIPLNKHSIINVNEYQYYIYTCDDIIYLVKHDEKIHNAN